jgi:hypothetical protein
MTALANRAEKFNKLYKVVKKYYQPVLSPANRTVLEHLVYACCLEDSTHEAADEVLAKLQVDYFDWNEIRVTTSLELAELSLNPLVQRELTLQGRIVLPANRFVPVPVASSGRLAALEQAQRQFDERSKLLTASFSADRLRRTQPLVEDLLWKVMLGVVTPQQGTEALLRLSPPR